jgi:hypothetical protein
MDSENEDLRTAEIHNDSLRDGLLRQVLKLMASLFSAFVSSSFVGMVIFFILFITIIISGGIQGRYSIALDQMPILIIAAAFFTLAYGILAPMFSLFQIVIFGIPAVLIGWKLKLIRWWTCVIVGFFLASFPWSLFAILVTIAQNSSRYPPHLEEIVFGVGIFLVLGLCGGIGGFCFWLTLRLLRFPDINQPKKLQLVMQNNGS